MTYIPIDSAHLTQQLQNDVVYWRTVILWMAERTKVYNTNLTTTQMTSLGISTSDQNAILAFIADLNRTYNFTQGTLPGVAADQLLDCAGVLGVV